MSLYFKNINLLKKIQPEIEAWIQENPPTSIDWIQAKTKVWTCRLGGHLLYSQYDPQKEVAHKLAMIDLNRFPTLVFLGFGLGYEIQSVIRQATNHHFIIVIEDLSFFNQVLHQIDCSLILSYPHLTLVFPPDPLEPLRDLTPLLIKGFTFITQDAANKIYSDYFKKIKEFILYLFNNLNSTYITHIMGQQREVSNLLLNLPAYFKCHHIEFYRNKLKNIPIICVGAGPSLDLAFDFLRKVKDYAFIVCADTAFPVLMRENIVPDMIAALDPGLKNFRHFEKYWVNTSSITLLADPIITPHIVRHYPGNIIFTSRESPILAFFNQNQLSSLFYKGITVASFMTCAAHMLGGSPLFLIGIDFAYPCNHSYAKGTAKKESKFKLDAQGKKYTEELDINGNIIQHYLKNVKSVSGKSIETDMFLYMFMCDMANFITSHKLEDQMINLSPIGAMIPHTRSLTFDQAIQAYFQDKSAKPAFFKKEQPLLKNDAFIQKLNNLLLIIQEISHLSDTAIQLLNHSPIATESLIVINEIHEKLATPPFVSDILQQLMSVQQYLIHQSDNQTEGDKIKTNLLFFTGIQASTKIYENLLINTIKNADNIPLAPQNCPCCSQSNFLPMDVFKEEIFDAGLLDYAELLATGLFGCKNCGLVFNSSRINSINNSDPADYQEWIQSFQVLDLKNNIETNIASFKSAIEPLPQNSRIGFWFHDYLYVSNQQAGNPFHIAKHGYICQKTVPQLLKCCGFVIEKMVSKNEVVYVIAQRKVQDLEINSFNFLEITQDLRILKQKKYYLYKAALFSQSGKTVEALRFLNLANALK